MDIKKHYFTSENPDAGTSGFSVGLIVASVSIQPLTDIEHGYTYRNRDQDIK